MHAKRNGVTAPRTAGSPIISGDSANRYTWCQAKQCCTPPKPRLTLTKAGSLIVLSDSANRSTLIDSPNRSAIGL